MSTLGIPYMSSILNPGGIPTFTRGIGCF